MPRGLTRFVIHCYPSVIHSFGRGIVVTVPTIRKFWALTKDYALLLILYRIQRQTVFL